jgi:hypothetical protein
LAPFIKSGSLSAQRLSATPQSDVSAVFHAAYTPAQCDISLQSALFSTPLLTQLALFVPNPTLFTTHDISIIYSANRLTFSALKVLQALRQPGQNRILLASGLPSSRIEKKINPLCFGVFVQHADLCNSPSIAEGNSKGRKQQPLGAIRRIFQCNPIHRVYRNLLPDTYGHASIEENGESASIRLSLATEGGGRVCLEIAEGRESGSFRTPNCIDERGLPENLTNISFQPEAVEVLETGRYPFPDRIFDIP